MNKADNLHLSGTTKNRIGKKNIPESPKQPKKIEKKTTEKLKIKKTNVELSEQLHFKAKVTAMELNKSLKDYIADLILADLVQRGKA